MTNQEKEFLLNRNQEIIPYIANYQERLVHLLEHEVISCLLELEMADISKIPDVDKKKILDECVNTVLSFHRKYLLHNDSCSFEEYQKISNNMVFYIDILCKEFGFKDAVQRNNFD